MKKGLIYLLTIFLFVACSDDEQSGFSTNMSQDSFQFRPIAGGSVMHYQLPDDPDIMGINVRYKDAFGDDIFKSASSLCDSIILTGFNEAQENIHASVTLCRRDRTESEPIDITFSTKDSGPITFINNLTVKSGWNGFSVSWPHMEDIRGMAHVFYLGVDPLTNEPDTILIDNFNLQEDEDLIVYQPQQESSVYDIVVRVEDYRGHMVRERVWPQIASISTKKLDASDFDFVCDNIVTSEKDKIGVKYLFDGDTKGTTWWENGIKTEFYTFLAGPDAAGESAHPMYFDLKKTRMVAELRIYCMLGYQSGKGPQFTSYSGAETQNIWYTYYFNKLPCEVTVYGCKEENANLDWENMTWEKIGSFEEDPSLAFKNRWCSYAAGATYNYVRLDRAGMEEHDPAYMAIKFDAEQGSGYRYLKMVVNEVGGLGFNSNNFNMRNGAKYVTMHELEIYSNIN